jgi:hypothetical protein
LNGIIAHRTRVYGGDVHEKVIVTVTSKSVSDKPAFAMANVADLTSDSWFFSQIMTGDQGEWVC